jgi:hypothetical protein
VTQPFQVLWLLVEQFWTQFHPFQVQVQVWLSLSHSLQLIQFASLLLAPTLTSLAKGMIEM